jgi:2-polyprenyl-6-methoxyphenol hydroxylase-like FAD-dependent oxidoreductase
LSHPQTPGLNVGIVGGGIGGVAAAVALHQVGVKVTVYERSARMREVGAGMMLWPNATRVLHAMGLLEKLAANKDASTHFLVRTSSGKVLMKIVLGNSAVPAICVRRADLLGALLEALPDKQIRLSHEFLRVENLADRVRVHFANGQASEHDMVIGADGLRSRVRQALFGKSEPIYRGYQIWRGIGRYDGQAISRQASSETWGIGQRFGILVIGQGEFTWYATANLPVNHADADPKNELKRLFTGWHEPILDLIDSTPEAAVLKHPAYDNIPLPHWTVGRVALLGDAAHPCTPNLGQGGCMALEDALVLARCIGKNRSIETALRRYEDLRRARTRHVQQRSRLMGRIGQWENRAIVGGRRVVTNLLPAKIFEYNLRRLYSYRSLAS